MTPRRTITAALASALLACASRPAHADVGPPPRVECANDRGPCWIDGKLRGECIDGICRYGAVASASAAPSSAPSAGAPNDAAPSGCAIGTPVSQEHGVVVAMLVAACIIAMRGRRGARDR